MRSEGIHGQLVLQRNTMEYDKPIFGDFTARSSLAKAEDWPKFTRTLARKGKARLTVTAVLEHEEKVVGRLAGEFVALGEPSA